MIGCFDGWLTADHLSAIGGSRACLLRSILAAEGGLGRHVEGPWRCQGLGLGPGVARGRQNGLDCTPVRAGALFLWDPGIQGTAKGKGGFGVSGPYYQSNNCLIQELLFQNCLIEDLGR